MRAVLLALALPACTPWHQEASRLTPAIAFDQDGVRGGELSVAHAINGVAVTFDVQGQRYERDEVTLDPAFELHRSSTGFGLDLGMRLSPLGMIATDDRFTRWFDLGVAGAMGGGLLYASRVTTYGQIWGGGWATIGLPGVGDIHADLVFELRREAVADWDNHTVFTVGLAIVRRYAQQALFAPRVPVR